MAKAISKRGRIPFLLCYIRAAEKSQEACREKFRFGAYPLVSNDLAYKHHEAIPLPHAAQVDWFAWMDFFRTAAAVIVVISHARDIVMADYSGQLLYAPVYAATGFGHSGVVIFFVLSGFWISRSVLGRIGTVNFWRGYLIDRLSRLLIVLVPALLLGGVLDWIGAVELSLPLYGGASGSHTITVPVVDQLRPEVLIGNLTFLQTIAVPTWGSNGPLWSLAYEFWFYIWFPALMLLVSRRHFSLALVSLAVAWFNPAIAFGFASWLAGFVLLSATGKLPSVPTGKWRAGLVTGAFLAILLLSGVRSNGAIDFVLAVAFASLLYVLRASQIGFPKLLQPLARYGRESSYSLYVIHFPVLALAGSLATGGQRLVPSPLSVAMVVGFSFAAVTTGWIFSQLTERNTGNARAFLRRKFA